MFLPWLYLQIIGCSSRRRLINLFIMSILSLNILKQVKITSSFRISLRTSSIGRLRNDVEKLARTGTLGINNKLFSSQSSVPQAVANTYPTRDYFKVQSDDEIDFGDFELIASQERASRNYTNIGSLGTLQSSHVGTKVWIRGRITNIRAKGNMCFLVIRDGPFHTIQAVHFKDKSQSDKSKAMIKFLAAHSLESIVDIYGEVAAADVKSCTQSNVEIHIRKLYTVSRAPATLPFLLEDASRSQEEIDASQSTDRPFAAVSQVFVQKNENY